MTQIAAALKATLQLFIETSSFHPVQSSRWNIYPTETATGTGFKGISMPTNRPAGRPTLQPWRNEPHIGARVPGVELCGGIPNAAGARDTGKGGAVALT